MEEDTSYPDHSEGKSNVQKSVGVKPKRNDVTYGEFKVQAGRMLTSSNVAEIATALELSPAETDQVEKSDNPGLALIRKLDEKNIISETSIEILTNIMEKLELLGHASRMKGLFSKPKVKPFYKYFPSGVFDGDDSIGEDFIKKLHLRAMEKYNEKISNYGLTKHRDLKLSEAPRDIINIAVIGKTGAGKTSTINTILGTTFAEVISSSRSQTRRTSSGDCVYKGHKIRIADTPGLMDNTQSEECVMEELKRLIFLQREGINCFIFCINASETRFTEESKKALDVIKGLGDGDMNHYVMVLYTKAETELDNQTLDEFLTKQKESDDLKTFITAIDDRVVAVNNKTKIPAEIERNKDAIVAMVDKVIEENKRNNRPDIITSKILEEGRNLVEKVITVVKYMKFHPVLVDIVLESIANRPQVQDGREGFVTSVANKLLEKTICTLELPRCLKFREDYIEDMGRTFITHDDIESIHIEIEPTLNTFSKVLKKFAAIFVGSSISVVALVILTGIVLPQLTSTSVDVLRSL